MTTLTHTYPGGVLRPGGRVEVREMISAGGVERRDAELADAYAYSATAPTASLAAPAGTPSSPAVYEVTHDRSWMLPAGWSSTAYIRLDGSEGSTVALASLTPHATPEVARAGTVPPLRTAGLPSGVALRAALASDESAVVRLVSDSTGTDADEWFGLLGALIGQAHPDRSVWWQSWDDSAQTLRLPWESPTIQDGADGVRAVLLAGTGAVNHPDPGGTGDLQATFIGTPTGMTWDEITTNPVLMTQTLSSGTQRQWLLRVMSGGTLRFQWSEDGSSYESAVNSSSTIPDDANGVRATLDVDDGASQHVVTLEYTTDRGATWSSLGTPTTRSGTTSVHDDSPTTDVPVRLGYTAGFDSFVGRVEWVELRRGDLLASLVPSLPERWRFTDDNDDTPTVVGAPVVLLLACADSGEDISHWTTHLDQVTADAGEDLMVVQLLHNQQESNSAYHAALGDWLDAYRAARPYVPALVLTGNSKISPPHDEQEVREMGTRRLAVMRVAGSRGDVDGLDTFPALAGATTAEIPDGTHPSAGLDGGSGHQARYVAAALGVA